MNRDKWANNASGENLVPVHVRLTDVNVVYLLALFRFSLTYIIA